MAVLSVQAVQPSGLAAAYAAAAAGGDKIAPGDDVFLHVKNGGGAAVNVTVASPTLCNQGSTHNLVVAVPAGADRMIGPFPAQRYAGPDGLVGVTYSATAGVTVAAVRTGGR